MRFIRIALVTLFSRRRVAIKPFGVLWEDLIINVQKGVRQKNGVRFVVSSEVTLPTLPALDETNRIIIPVEIRERTEKGIEFLANFLSVLTQSGRKVESTVPSRALRHENPEEASFLNASVGFADDSLLRMRSRCVITFDTSLLELVADRPEGVALLAEAMGHKIATGRLVEFMRFFERAFDGNISSVRKKLSGYLAATDMGFTEAEVEHWLTLRHQTVHGKQGDFVLELSVSPIIHRVEQAALDVLFNKAAWATGAIDRRPFLVFDMFSASDVGEPKVVAQQGAKFEVNAEDYDEFGAFFRSDYSLTSLPPGMWNPDMGVAAGRKAKTVVRVIERRKGGWTENVIAAPLDTDEAD